MSFGVWVPFLEYGAEGVATCKTIWLTGTKKFVALWMYKLFPDVLQELKYHEGTCMYVLCSLQIQCYSACLT